MAQNSVDDTKLGQWHKTRSIAQNSKQEVAKIIKTGSKVLGRGCIKASGVDFDVNRSNKIGKLNTENSFECVYL